MRFELSLTVGVGVNVFQFSYEPTGVYAYIKKMTNFLFNFFPEASFKMLDLLIKIISFWFVLIS